MTLEHFAGSDGLPPTAGYSHAVVGDGRLVAVSGQLPVSADGRLIEPSDPLSQARRVFKNLREALALTGAGPADVIRLGFFLIDLEDLTHVRVARDEFIGTDRPPASSLVQVAGLVIAGARLEIEALAVIAADN